MTTKMTRNDRTLAAALLLFTYLASPFMACCGTETQVWRENPDNAVWSTTALNWDDGAAWSQSNSAVFAESAIKEISVPATTIVYQVDFLVDGYRLSGDGPLCSRRTGQQNSNDPESDFIVAVTNDASVEISVPIDIGYGGNFFKDGEGELTLSQDCYLFRTAVRSGTLRVVDCQLTTAKIQDYSSSTPRAKLHLDGVRIAPINNNTMLGEVGNQFGELTVGAGGITFTNTGLHVISWLKLNHAMQPAEGGDGGVTMAGPYSLYIDSETCDLTGGFKFLAGTSYLKHRRGLGSGPVTLDAPLYVTNSMTLANSIVWGPSGVLGLYGPATWLEITNVTFSADNVAKRLHFSSQGGGTVRHVSRMDSEPVGGYLLTGGVSLKADGDTFRLAPTAEPPFVVQEDATQPVQVGLNGLTFDTNGRDSSFGAPLAFAHVVVSNYVEHAFTNGSFENGTQGWTFDKGQNAGSSDVRANGSPFDNNEPGYVTASGTHYAQVRSKGGSISTTFSAPSDGEWCIAFEYSDREGYNTGELEWEVQVDGVAIREMAADGVKHGFVSYTSAPIFLRAGEEHTFKFITGESHVNYGYDSMLVDNVRLARYEDEELLAGGLSKVGAGRLSVFCEAGPATLDVQAGTLKADGDLSGKTVNVAADATFEFAYAVDVDVPNASFEEGTREADYNANGAIPGWTLTTRFNAASGWQGNGGTVSATSPWTTNGTHTALLRPLTDMSTSVSVPEDGEYELSFEHSVRYNAGAAEWSSGYLMEILATIDGDEVVRIPARDASNYGFLPASGRIFLTAGQHVLKFETDDGPEHQLARASGPMVFVDAVRLVGSKASFADNEGTWNFAAGATVDVGTLDAELENAYVGGVRVRGGTEAFRKAGLTVVGSGSLRSGPPGGLKIIIR